MTKYKSTEQVMKIISDKNKIRNFGVIAHVDHGKTTMSDSLLAASGIISPSSAGSALAMAVSYTHLTLPTILLV